MPAALSFTAFVISLASSAAIHFGDLVDPNTGRPSDVNLEGAQQMIEILALMEDKTKGYGNGGNCPKCGGLVQVRTGTTIRNGKEVPGFRYAQCSKYSWNSMRG